MAGDNLGKYFRDYRHRLGFTSQGEAKNYLAAKDIIPEVNIPYLHDLTARIREMIEKINGLIYTKYQKNEIEAFISEAVKKPYNKIVAGGLISKLNNQGRRPEGVLFSWLRGYAVCELFIHAIADIFNVPVNSITKIGDDNWNDPATFKRTPRADLKILRGGTEVLIEVQTGFQDANDVKEHKVREACRVFDSQGVKTVCVHIDIFNGQVAFVRLDTIEDTDVSWVTRQQMEGQSVFEIRQNYFKWRFIEAPPSLDELELDL